MNAPLLPALPGYTNPELIAHGTTALVFRATQTTLNRLVAIKVITVDTGSVPVNAARELATTVALSSQPHIVSIIDTGITGDDRPYIVMEYCEGGSYAGILRQGGPLPLADVLELGVKIGEALHAAHQAGIVHRDVKPSNILRSRFGPALTDFGIARAPDELGSTLTRELMTPHHASPEALLHQAQSGISDIYSLASTMWTLLVGHPPFVDPLQPAMDMYAFRDRVLHDDLPAMPREDVPAWLVTELRRAMSKLPSERHRTALEFAESLRRGSLGLGPSAATTTEPAPSVASMPAEGPGPAGSGTGGTLAGTGSSRLAAANAAGVLPAAGASAYGQPATFVPPPAREAPASTLDEPPAVARGTATPPAPRSAEPPAPAPVEPPVYVSPWTTSPATPTGSAASDRASANDGAPTSDAAAANEGAVASDEAAPRALVSESVEAAGASPLSREDTGGATTGGTGGRRRDAASRPPVIPPLAAVAPPAAPWTLPPTTTPAPPPSAPVSAAPVSSPAATAASAPASTPPVSAPPVSAAPVSTPHPAFPPGVATVPAGPRTPAEAPAGPVPLPPFSPGTPPPGPAHPPAYGPAQGPAQVPAYGAAQAPAFDSTQAPAFDPTQAPARPSAHGPAATAAALAPPARTAPPGQPYPTYPTRRIEEPRVAPTSNRRGVLIGVLVAVALVAIAGAAVAVLLAKDRPQTSQGPTHSPPVTGTAASPQATKFITPNPLGAPTNVRVIDARGPSLTVTWTDPSPGTVSFAVVEYVNAKPVTTNFVDRGITTTTFNQLSTTQNYCFVVGAVYSTTNIATTEPVCTKR